MSVPFAAAVWFLTKEPNREKAGSAKEYFGDIVKVFKKKGVPLVACFWAGTVALFILFGVLFFLSEHLESAHGVEGVPKGTALMWPVLAMSVTSFGAGLFLRKNQGLLKPAVVAGLGIALAGVLLVAFVPQDWAFFTGIIVGGVGTGLQLPGLNNLITSSVGSGQRAMVTSIYGAVRFIGVAFGPPLYGALMRYGEAMPFWFSAAVLGFTLVVTIFLIHPEQLIGTSEGKKPAGGGGGGGSGGKRLPAWQVPGSLPKGTRPDPL